MCGTGELYVRLGCVVCATWMSYTCGSDEFMCCTDELYVRHR